MVAGAVVHDDRLLVARRTRPAALAGRWELPGGKADPGESETAALRRELAEELGLAVDVGERIGPDIELGDRLVLRCRLARPTDPGAPLRASEHYLLRWLPAADLDGLHWIDADRALMPQLRAALDS
ncbi:(deoxy)nucleoside triphosphate pyrophosphohydrolase, partial [Nakamurella sp.]|uniref:(deoxy)nucleoside triphosphate pyrophosphohydrolase n=1 Tax=Nakamurella sp. TaxID=1869182 RepID=UPI003B3A3243